MNRKISDKDKKDWKDFTSNTDRLPNKDFNLTENNKLGFSTKKNFKTDSTELYDISYQYMIDCLTAGLYYRREFYTDSDIEERDTLMFKITFVPFIGVKTPSLKQ